MEHVPALPKEGLSSVYVPSVLDQTGEQVSQPQAAHKQQHSVNADKPS